MSLTEASLIQAAAATGFQTEPLEKAVRLLELLETLRSHSARVDPNVALRLE